MRGPRGTEDRPVSHAYTVDIDATGLPGSRKYRVCCLSRHDQGHWVERESIERKRLSRRLLKWSLKRR